MSNVVDRLPQRELRSELLGSRSMTVRALLVSRISARRAWLLVVAFSLLVRLAVLSLVHGAPVASDARDYIAMAAQIRSGRPFVPYWPPGTPLLLTPLLAAGASETMLRAATLVFWLLCCWGLFRLMEALEVAGAAWLVLLVFSLLPDAIQMSLEPMTQMPAAALLLLALGSTVRILRGWNAVGEAVLLGVSLGVLCLVRPSTGPLVVWLPVGMAWFSRRWQPSLLSLALAAMLIVAWVHHAHAMTDRWMVNTANAVNLFYGNNPWTPAYRTWYFGSHAKLGSEEIAAFPEYAGELQRVQLLPELDRPAAFQRLAVNYLKAHPGKFLLRTANRMRAFLGFDTFTSAALSRTRCLGMQLTRPTLLLEALAYLAIVVPGVFFLASAAGAFWSKGATVVLAGAMALYAMPYWLTMSHPTYHFPLLLPFAALGTAAGATRFPRNSVRGWIAVGLLLLVQAEWIWQASWSARHGGG